jgi:hypothetical protein
VPVPLGGSGWPLQGPDALVLVASAALLALAAIVRRVRAAGGWRPLPPAAS